MKRLFTFIAALLFCSLGFGQTVQKIHRNDGSIRQNPVTEIDSVNFSESPATLQLRTSDGSLQEVLITEIDSITFSENEAEVNWGKRLQIPLAGQIQDELGQPLPGVIVQVGDSEAISDANGVFYFQDASVRERLGYVRASKAGYFLGSRSFLPRSGVNTVKITLLQKNLAGIVNAVTGGTVQAEGVSIAFTAGSFSKNGTPYTGEVQVAINYIDPEGSRFDSEMPGNLLGMIGGTSRALKSYGMVAVELTDNSGNLLELASGKTAEIRFPLSTALQNDAPSQIDFWYFDEENGLWQHEGTANKQGNEYLTDVSHFSFWNCDIPFPYVELNGTITDAEGNPVSGAKVTIFSPAAGSRSDYTSSSGGFGGFVPSGVVLTMKVSISCEGAGLYQEMYSQEIGPFSQRTSLSPIATASPDVSLISGVIKGCQNNTVKSGYIVAAGNVFFADTSGNFSFVTCRNGNLTLNAITAYPRAEGIPKSINITGSKVDAGEFLVCSQPGGTVSDIDGNQYTAVTIGTQEWMAENLKTSKFADGSVIPNITDNTAWTQLSSPAWCNYQNNTSYDGTYGKLYNWFTVADPRNVCPTGWHVPSDTEWTTLTDFLGGLSIAGGKMKSVTGWNAPNTGATNESAFSGLPGGYRYYASGVFNDVGSYGTWWSSSGSTSTDAWGRYLGYNYYSANRNSSSKPYGISVRCIKD